MKYLELLATAPPNGLFRTGQILAGRDPAAVRRQLARWVANGKLEQLRRGVYRLSTPQGGRAPHPYQVANTLKKASYVSTHSALAHYGMIPEYVAAITSSTTGRPEEITTPSGRYLYRHLTTRLFFGFAAIKVSTDQEALLASPEKALVDLLYLTPGSDQIDYLRELRLERSAAFDDERFQLTAARTESAKVVRAARQLAEIWNRGVFQ